MFMRPYMTDLVPAEDLLLFEKIEGQIQKMPEVDLGVNKEGRKVLVSCHMVARALARIFPEVAYKDGYFGRHGQRHSWLRVKRNPKLIIDPYPIALIGGPIMVHGGFITTPWDKLYIEAKLTELGGWEFRHHVKLVESAMRNGK